MKVPLDDRIQVSGMAAGPIADLTAEHACVADGYARAFGRIRDAIATRDPVTSGTN
jgi:hypothetical protein